MIEQADGLIGDILKIEPQIAPSMLVSQLVDRALIQSDKCTMPVAPLVLQSTIFSTTLATSSFLPLAAPMLVEDLLANNTFSSSSSSSQYWGLVESVVLPLAATKDFFIDNQALIVAQSVIPQEPATMLVSSTPEA